MCVSQSTEIINPALTHMQPYIPTVHTFQTLVSISIRQRPPVSRQQAGPHQHHLRRPLVLLCSPPSSFLRGSPWFQVQRPPGVQTRWPRNGPAGVPCCCQCSGGQSRAVADLRCGQSAGNTVECIQLEDAKHTGLGCTFSRCYVGTTMRRVEHVLNDLVQAL